MNIMAQITEKESWTIRNIAQNICDEEAKEYDSRLEQDIYDALVKIVLQVRSSDEISQ